MNKRTAQLATLLALAAGLTGFRSEVQTSATSNTPLVRKVETKTRTNMSHCNWYALGWIGAGQTKSLDDIMQQMTAGADGMVDISVESSTTNLAVVAWQCWRVAGTPFSWGAPLYNPPASEAAAVTEGSSEATDAASAPAEAPAVAAPPPPPMAVIVPPPHPKAMPLTERLLKLIGAKRPESDDDYRRLCSEVWTLRQQNKFSDATMLKMARKGASQVAPGSDLLTVLKAGVAASAGN